MISKRIYYDAQERTASGYVTKSERTANYHQFIKLFLCFNLNETNSKMPERYDYL